MRPATRRLADVRWLVVFLTACLAASIAPVRSASAVAYTWSNAATGGPWSGTANWTPNSLSGGPTAGDTVVLNTTASDTLRTVTIDSTAWGAATSGTITSLTLTQTNSGTNTLEVGKNLRVTNAVTLGGNGGGLSRIFLNPQTGTVSGTATFSGGLTLNAGGMLSLGAFNPSSTSTVFNSTISGNVTVQGGSLVVEPFVKNGTATTAQSSNFTGSLTMTSGSLVLNNTSIGTGSVSLDRRLGVSNNLSITGGTVRAENATSGGLFLSGSTNTFRPDAISGTVPQMTLQGTNSVALTSNQIFARVLARGNGVKTYTSEVSGTNFGAVDISDDNASPASSRTTFRLGSNLTLQSGRTLPAASANSVHESGRIDLGIDTNGYTFNISGTYGTWAPGFAGTSVTYAVWDLSGSGTMIANGYNFSSSVGPSGAVNIGAGLTLESRSGANGVNDLGSGTGTIDATSTFRYSGTATAANPSTLTRSGGLIGNLEVTSGALKILSLGGLQALRVTGGMLDLGDNSLTVSSGSFGSGTVQSGTLSTAGLFSASSGTISAALTGSGSFSKVGSGTAMLSGTNSYAGATTVTGGALIVTTSAALPGIVAPGGFSVASDATLAVTSGVDTAIVEAMLATGNFAAGSVAEIDTTGANRTIGSAIGGGLGLRKSGGNTLTLTGASSYSGGTLVTGTGALAIANVSALGTGMLTLRSSRNDTAAIFEIGSSGTLTNAVTIDMADSGRNNITVTSGSAVLAGPIAILGTASRTQIFASNGSGFEIRGNVSAASFASLLSFRGSGATGVISGTVNAPNARFEVNGTNAASWLVTSTGNVWSSTEIGATGSFILGADDALATGAKVFWYQTPTGGVDLNGFVQTIAGLDSGTTAAGAGRVTNNSVSSDSTLTLAGLASNYEFRGLLTDGTNGRPMALMMNSPARVQTLSGSSSYTGGTTIVAGTIALGHANGLGGGGPLAVNGGGLDLRGVSPTVGALSGSATGLITSSTAGAATLTVSSISDSVFAGLIENGLGTVGLTKTGSGKLTLTADHPYTGATNVNGGTLAVNGSLASTVTVGLGGEIGGSGSVGTIGGAGLVGPGNSPGILEASSVDPSSSLDFAFEFTQAAPNYASPTASDNDLLWLTGGTAFASNLSPANIVKIYLTPDLLAMESLTGGFFTATAGDFVLSISDATFQYFVQDDEGTVPYGGQNYKPLSEYDASKSFDVSTVAANGGQVMQLVVVPEPGAFLLAGVGVAAAAWAARVRRPSAG